MAQFLDLDDDDELGNAVAKILEHLEKAGLVDCRP
jgi:hypothetical protein